MSTGSFAIGIGGGTGAGKTTVAREISNRVGEDVTIIPLDDYYEDNSNLPVEERTEINYDHPSSFDWELLREQFARLLSGEAIEKPHYDYENHVRMETTTHVEPTGVIILEGILALYDEAIDEMLDLHLYVDTDADVRIIRRIRRDVIERDRDLEDVTDRYLSSVKPMHERFVAPTKTNADLVLPNGANRVAIDVLQEKISSLQ